MMILTRFLVFTVLLYVAMEASLRWFPEYWRGLGGEFVTYGPTLFLGPGAAAVVAWLLLEALFERGE